jgi:diamine N-acetyltransferase
MKKCMKTNPVSLREIDDKNIKAVLALSVTEKQKQVYPRSNAYSIAEGHYPPDDDPVWMRAIYAEEIPVGFIMTSEVPEEGIYFIWRIMVDAEHQGKGYGAKAVKLLIDRAMNIGNPKEILTSHLKGDGDAGGFYLNLGFRYTGEIVDTNDYMMKMEFYA